MTSRAKAAADGDKSPSMWSWLSNHATKLTTKTVPWITWGVYVVRQIGWGVVVVGIVTLLPLIVEVGREGELERLEAEYVGKSLAEGKTPHELAMGEGIASAVAPPVL